MIASIIVVVCCVCVSVVCHVRTDDAAALRRWRRAFGTAFLLGAIIPPLSRWVAGQAADAISLDANGYRTVVGMSLDSEIPIIFGLLTLTVAVLAWPVALWAGRPVPAPRAILRMSFAVATGHITGILLSDLMMRWQSFGYSNDSRRSEAFIDMLHALLMHSAEFLAIWFVCAFVLRILVCRRRRILAFIVGVVVATPLTFPIICLPDSIVPEQWPILFRQYASQAFGPLCIFVISGVQWVASAVVAVAGLTWVAAWPGDYPASKSAIPARQPTTMGAQAT